MNLPQYTGLKYLEVHRVQNFNLNHIFDRARGAQLKQLYCNAVKPLSIDCQLTKPECRELERVFNALKDELKTGQISDRLEIFLHQVRVANNNRVFSDFGFHEKLGSVYFSNWIAPGPDARSMLGENSTVLQVNYISLYEFLPEITNGDKRFNMLLAGFPNIQRIVLDKTSALLDNRLLPDQFSSFLERCKALTELKLINLRFRSTFYQSLRLCESLTTTLNTLIIIERVGFAEHINFEFLQYFEYLRIFTTNLANKQDALDILSDRFRRIDSKFVFFFQEADDAACNELQAHRVSSDPADAVRLVLIEDPEDSRSLYERIGELRIDGENRVVRSHGKIISDSKLKVAQLKTGLFYENQYETFFRHWKPVTNGLARPRADLARFGLI